MCPLFADIFRTRIRSLCDTSTSGFPFCVVCTLLGTRAVVLIEARNDHFVARCKSVVATLRKWRDKHGDESMPFWKLNRRHPWSEREHEEVRVALLNQRLIEYEERKTGGTPQRPYRVV